MGMIFAVRVTVNKLFFCSFGGTILRMIKTPWYGELAMKLNRASNTPLSRQIYSEMAHRILSGELRPDARIPSARQLSGDLQVSRNTVNAAYDQLAAEGYIERTVGAGSRVSGAVPAIAPLGDGGHRNGARKPHISTRGRYLTEWTKVINDLESGAQHIGAPALDFLPIKLWKRLMTHQLERLSKDELGYGESAGYFPLRAAIASHLNRTRGLEVSSQQIVIVSGTQQALDLLSRVLLDPKDPVLFEEPGYPGARAAFMGGGTTLVPVPVDHEGMNLDTLSASQLDARAAYITPAHQFPLGVTMSLSRRLALLEWAEAFNAWIIEDDYDGEYRFAGKPLSALASIAKSERVIYVGTFSKVLFPGLRIGFVVLPEDLAERFASARGYMDRQSPILEQATLAAFMAGGHYDRHIRKMRRVYGERRAAVIQAFQNHGSGLIAIEAPETGMHVIVRLTAAVSEQRAADIFTEHGLPAMPIGSYFMNKPTARGLLVSFANIRVQDIDSGVRKLVAALEAATRN